MDSENGRRSTNPLAILFQELLLLALAIACFQLLPDEDFLRRYGRGGYWWHLLLLSCLGSVVGAAIGRLYEKTRKGALIGLGLSFPVAFAMTCLRAYRHAMGT
jgi:hypothetical protein